MLMRHCVNNYMSSENRKYLKQLKDNMDKEKEQRKNEKQQRTAFNKQNLSGHLDRIKNPFDSSYIWKSIKRILETSSLERYPGWVIEKIETQVGDDKKCSLDVADTYPAVSLRTLLAEPMPSITSPPRT